MIPSDPEVIKQLEALADRNIANGDWGDEVALPGEDVPLSLVEHQAKATVTDILVKHGDLSLPKEQDTE